LDLDNNICLNYWIGKDVTQSDIWKLKKVDPFQWHMLTDCILICVCVHVCVYELYLYNSFVSSYAVTWIFPKEKWHNLIRIISRVGFGLLFVMHIMKSHRPSKWHWKQQKEGRGYYCPANEVTHPAKHIQTKIGIKLTIFSILAWIVDVNFIFIFKLKFSPQ